MANASEGGPIDTTLGWQLVIVLFATWEGEFRPWLARIRECDSKAIEVPFFGDLRRLRNDIVHNHAIANQSVDCEVLIWFEKGEAIQIVGDRVAKLIAAVPFDHLADTQ